MGFQNLTPHPIVVRTANGDWVIEPSGILARVDEKTDPLSDCRCQFGEAEEEMIVPFVTKRYGEVENLPEPEQSTFFIVSKMVVDALKGKRYDLVSPDTGRAIRDGKGQIVAVPALVYPYIDKDILNLV